MDCHGKRVWVSVGTPDSHRGRRANGIYVSNLVAAFNAVHQRSGGTRLQTVSLEVMEYVDGKLCRPDFPIPVFRFDAKKNDHKSMYQNSLREIWEAAASSLNVLILALQATDLKVNTLELLTNQIGCSIACDRLELLAKPNRRPLRNVKRLSLRFSHRIPTIPDSEQQLRAAFGIHTDPDYSNHKRHSAHAADVAQFLRLFPSLTSLELHWYNLSNSPAIDVL